MTNLEPLQEGWYLMSVPDLEVELRRWREPESEMPPTNAVALSVDAALAFRDAGNCPDELDRTLRLVLLGDSPDEARSFDHKRQLFEPDFHAAPTWRREGSRPINIVPLRSSEAVPGTQESWLDDPEVASLEAEWRRYGTVAGIPVDGDYRSFVFKTALALRAAGLPVNRDTVLDSAARWLGPDDVERLRVALHAAS